MAKVVINVDTDAKTLEVKVGSQVIDSVRNVEIYSEESGMGFFIDISQVEDFEGMKKVTRLVANQTAKAAEFAKVGKLEKSKYEGFSELTVSKLQEQIAQYIESR